jgi:putative ABC transport system ATP-binding protein
MTLSNITADSTHAARPRPPSAASDPAPAPAREMISLRGIEKTFVRGNETLRILQGLDLQIEEGAFVALMGPSGSGKSTLLNLIAGLDRPTSGSCVVAGNDLGRMNDTELSDFRAQHIGFVFQSYHLLPVLNARENVELPLLLRKLPAAERKQRAQNALRIVGLAERASSYPRQLSGGQEQRVAIARAIVGDPEILVCDEPTGDLDRKAADEILLLLETLYKQFHKTIVMVTHDPQAAEHASCTRRLEKGGLL